MNCSDRYLMTDETAQASLAFFYKIHPGPVCLNKILTPAAGLKQTKVSHVSQYTRYLSYTDALEYFPRLFEKLSDIGFDAETTEES